MEERREEWKKKEKKRIKSKGRMAKME